MATNRQRSISCSDDDWAAIRRRAKGKGLSVSEYLVALATSDETDANNENFPLSKAEKSAFRAVWFLYVDRLSELKADGKQDRANQLIAEARRKFE